MAIAHDAQTRFPATETTGLDTTTGTRTFTHTPVGTPAGVVVVIGCVGTVAPVTGVLYDGVAMTLKQSALDIQENGSVWIYALTGVAIAAGAKTVTLEGCIAASKFVTCSTVTSATGYTQIVGENFKNTTTDVNPTLSVVTTATSLLYGGMHGGAAAPTSYVSPAGYTAQNLADYGALSAKTQRSTTTTAAGTITYDFTYATSDDYCIAAVALAEKAPPETLFGIVAQAITFVKTVTGIRPLSTPVARISLASHGNPSARTNHSIKIRARTTSGSTGVIKAALYEGATNRSGDLTSGLLTNVLADHMLIIPDASAENITDYSNLEIRLWGYDNNGNALVFEIANVYLQLPEFGVVTYYGIITSQFTFVKAVSGQRNTFSQIVAPFTFVKNVVAQKTALGQIVAPFTFIKNVVARRTTFGQITIPLTFTKSTNGVRKTFGQIVTPFTFVKNVVARRTAFGQITVPLTFIKSINGARKTFGQITVPLTFTKSTNGVRRALGQIVAPFTFVKNVVARRTTFGRISAPYTFDADLQGLKETFGLVDFPIDFLVDVNTGRVEAHSNLALELLLDFETAGMIIPIHIILNQAQVIYLGSTSVDAIYVDSQNVWSK